MPAIVFALWTLFVWGTRIRTADGAVGATLMALTFVALAIAVLAWRPRRSPLVIALAVWTIGVWAVRVVAISSHDHSVAFKAIHAVLAVVSTVLAVWAVRGVRAQDPSMALSVSGSKK